MLLLVRSAICIGLVVAALPDRSPQGDAAAFDSIAATAGTAAVTAAGRFCRRDPAACLHAMRTVPGSPSDATMEGPSGRTPLPRRG